MIRGLNASKLGMAVEQTRTEVLANNLANVNTSGFKKSVAVSTEFEAMLLQMLGDPLDEREGKVGSLGNGAAIDSILPVNRQGDIVETGRALDFALKGPGAFQVQGPTGVVTTRNGAFHRKDDGALTTAEGFPVLMREQSGSLTPVFAPEGALEIEANGTVLVGGQAVGQLALEGAAPETKIQSKALEASNVELAKEMTDLIVTLRSFQINQRALQIQDQSLSKAVTEIGKV